MGHTLDSIGSGIAQSGKDSVNFITDPSIQNIARASNPLGNFVSPQVEQIGADIAATAFGQPELIPLINAGITADTGISKGNSVGSSIGQGALAGAGSYVGGQVGGALLGSGAAAAPSGAGAISGSGAIGGLGGDVLSTGGDALSGGVGSSALSSAGPQLFGAGATSLPGETAGNAIGNISSAVGSSAPSGSGSILGTLSKGMGNINLGTVGSNLGPTISDALPSSVANIGIGAAGGAAAGQTLAQQLMGPPHTSPTPGWTPSQSAASSLPPSLSGLQTLNPGQQASNLATQGTFGGGIGPQEESYYTNLLNRQLVDTTGKVSDLSSLSPIENTYNQQLGLGGYTNSTDLLKALSSWSPN